MTAVKTVAAVVEGLQIAVGERQQAGVHPPLIALDAFAFQIHLALCGNNGFDIVGLLQHLHFHIVIHKKMNVFQIGAGKPVVGNFGDAAVFHIAAKQTRQHRTDLRFSLAALALEDHHALPFGAGNEAIADILLKGWDVLRVE